MQCRALEFCIGVKIWELGEFVMVASLSSNRTQLSHSSLKAFLDKKEETLPESFV